VELFGLAELPLGEVPLGLVVPAAPELPEFGLGPAGLLVVADGALPLERPVPEPVPLLEPVAVPLPLPELVALSVPVPVSLLHAASNALQAKTMTIFFMTLAPMFSCLPITSAKLLPIGGHAIGAQPDLSMSVSRNPRTAHSSYRQIRDTRRSSSSPRRALPPLLRRRL
jgi:hypothetical protein